MFIPLFLLSGDIYNYENQEKEDQEDDQDSDERLYSSPHLSPDPRESRGNFAECIPSYEYADKCYSTHDKSVFFAPVLVIDVFL